MHSEAQKLQQAMIQAITELIDEAEKKVLRLKKTKLEIDERLDIQARHMEMLQRKLKNLKSSNKSQSEVKTVSDMIIVVLLEAQQPMRASEIADKLDEEGFPTNAENGHRSSVLVTLRRRQDLFKRLERGVYALRDQDIGRLNDQYFRKDGADRKRAAYS